MRRILLEQFSPGVVLATLICLTWGTNLFHYAVFDGTFSHAYAFFLICVWMWMVERWWERPSVPLTLAIGAVAGLNVLVRHTNAIFILVLPLYGITSWGDLRGRTRALLARWRLLAIAAAVGMAVLAPQLALYKWITGEWIVNSYDAFGMGFTFASPRVADVLFSTQKGLFFWSPVLLLSVFGVVRCHRSRPRLHPAGGDDVRAANLADRELDAVAIRRQLWPSRVHRRLWARGACSRLVVCLGVASPVGGGGVRGGSDGVRPAVGGANASILDRGAADVRHDLGAVPGTVSEIPMSVRHWSIVALLAVGAALVYLRDPPWIGDVTSGMRPWDHDESGVLYRWTEGHASFYIPSNVHDHDHPDAIGGGHRRSLAGEGRVQTGWRDSRDHRASDTGGVGDLDVDIAIAEDATAVSAHRPARLADLSAVVIRRDDRGGRSALRFEDFRI